MDGACWLCFCCRHSPVSDMNVGIFWVCHSVRWNACVHRPDFIYTHPKEFLGNGVRNNVNSKRKIPSTRGSEEDGTCNAASCMTASPTHYQLSYSDPISCRYYLSLTSSFLFYLSSFMSLFCRLSLYLFSFPFSVICQFHIYMIYIQPLSEAFLFLPHLSCRYLADKIIISLCKVDQQRH